MPPPRDQVSDNRWKLINMADSKSDSTSPISVNGISEEVKQKANELKEKANEFFISMSRSVCMYY